MKLNARKMIGIAVIALFAVVLLTGCTDKDALNPKKPVTLTMWHVFGSQTSSPMNDLVKEFNDTIGKEQGVVINVTSISNSSDIHDALVPAARGDAGAGTLPDLFFCYPETAGIIGAERLVSWEDLFSEEELAEYIPAFLQEGTIDGNLLVFPVAKSSEALFVNTHIFDRFAVYAGVSYDDLQTWDGVFSVARKYHTYSDGKSFIMHDELLNFCQINTFALGGEAFVDGKVNFADPLFKEQWLTLAKAAMQGYLHVEDNYETVCMMTGDIIAGIGSTASILYFQDTVTYPDNTTEPLVLKALPCPVVEGGGGRKVAMQQGPGLAASVKGDKKKEAAALLFTKWITEGEVNLGFVTQSGYMPTQSSAFAAIGDFKYENEAYRSLYQAIEVMGEEYEFYLPPVVDGYYAILWDFYDNTLIVLEDYQKRYQAREGSLDELAEASYEAMREAMN